MPNDRSFDSAPVREITADPAKRFHFYRSHEEERLLIAHPRRMRQDATDMFVFPGEYSLIEWLCDRDPLIGQWASRLESLRRSGATFMRPHSIR